MGYKQLSLPKGKDEFPDGLILITGNNSYGKSTILEGLLFAFFGPKIFKGRNAASFITYGVQKLKFIYISLSIKENIISIESGVEQEALEQNCLNYQRIGRFIRK